MISLSFWTVDAFTCKTFGGNPAGVCLLKESLPDTVLLQVASEVALSETCFISPLDGDKGAQWSLRWFTPTNEVKLCGHGTLASATVLFQELGLTVEAIHFITLSGELTAKRHGDEIELVLPSYPGTASSQFDDLAHASACNLPIKEVLWSQELAYLTVVMEDSVTKDQIQRLDHSYDFYSRHFDPWQGIPEDPVTGSAHSVLAPYWGQRLAKTKMLARQCSKRGGNLQVTLKDDSLLVRGSAVIVIRGTFCILV